MRKILISALFGVSSVSFSEQIDGYSAGYFSSGDCSLYVRELKASPEKATYILINGIPVTSLVYDRLARKIHSDLNASVVLVDLPGTGSSRNSSYTWSSSEECVGRFLRSLKKEVYLVVHDIAGPISLPLLADDRISIKGVVILNTILNPTAFRPVFPLSLIRMRFLGAVVSPLIPFFYFEREMRKKGIDKNNSISKSEIRNLFNEFSRNFGKSRLHRVMRGFELDSERERRINLGLKSSVPKLTIWGLSDPSLGQQSRYISRIKNNVVVTMPKAKHFLMMDYSDEILEHIRTFSKSLD